ncbi:hypothetical protein [Collinsella sp. D33t1_170424_A12]|uniref:hypothetical protein n=1 Tax=Collinsella sp. D33t1_170424_A12 TaxID=2787135 RepID=UPI00189C2AB2|nr:hypothetical protein [Collinsella sp. D33t1_170424_A12]
MGNDRNASKSIISRKSFLCTATLSALGLIAGIAEPPSAFANEGGIPQHANSAEFEIVPEEEINRLWESALEKACGQRDSDPEKHHWTGSELQAFR